ncbi:hypothetical protein TNCV_3052711 [Trichonephila clavipes]|nr:hypothetical protein TNCV_3052711 [Trichonephila clavipes]
MSETGKVRPRTGQPGMEFLGKQRFLEVHKLDCRAIVEKKGYASAIFLDEHYLPIQKVWNNPSLERRKRSRIITLQYRCDVTIPTSKM